MTQVIDLSNGQIPANLPDMMVNLAYVNYKYNREHSPQITPEKWAMLFPHADLLEQRLQAEMKVRK